MTERVTLDGKPYVILPEAEFEELRRLAEDAEDEAAGIRAAARRAADVANGEHLSMPRDQWARIRQGENPLTVIREFRGMTKAELADKSGVNRPEISDIEAGKRRGSLDAWKAIAKALSAPLDVLTTQYAGAHGYTAVNPDGGFMAVIPDLRIKTVGDTREQAKQDALQIAPAKWVVLKLKDKPVLRTANQIGLSISPDPLEIERLALEPFVVELGEP